MAQWRLIQQADGLLLVEKPPRLAVIPGRGQTSPSLVERLQAELGKKIWVVHRLDRDTSGVMVFATTAERHRELSLLFEQHKVRKTYIALVEGQLTKPMEIAAPLVPARKSRMRVAKAGEEGKGALTQVTPVEIFPNATLVEATPLTGRTHQIRVHLSSIGHPLWVDHQYGNRSEWAGVLSRTPLHARTLAFENLNKIGHLEAMSPLSEDIEQALEALRRGL